MSFHVVAIVTRNLVQLCSLAIKLRSPVKAQIVSVSRAPVGPGLHFAN